MVRRGTCSGGAGSRLELTDMGDRIEVRFEVHRSPVGHEWRIRLRHATGIAPPDFNWAAFERGLVFLGTRVASDSGDLAVQLHFWESDGADAFKAKAVDLLTGQVCRVPEAGI